VTDALRALQRRRAAPAFPGLATLSRSETPSIIPAPPTRNLPAVLPSRTARAVAIGSESCGLGAAIPVRTIKGDDAPRALVKGIRVERGQVKRRHAVAAQGEDDE
jgi:hypothetical protein